MFGWEYPPLHSGGLGVACQGLVRGLMKNGTQITLVLPMEVHDLDQPVDTRSPSGIVTHCDVRAVASILQPYEGNAEYEERLTRRVGAMRFCEVSMDRIWDKRSNGSRPAVWRSRAM